MPSASTLFPLPLMPSPTSTYVTHGRLDTLLNQDAYRWQKGKDDNHTALTLAIPLNTVFTPPIWTLGVP